MLFIRSSLVLLSLHDLFFSFSEFLIPHLPDPRPLYNSVATMVKILEEKRFLDHESVGNVYPLLSYRHKRRLSKACYERYCLFIYIFPFARVIENRFTHLTAKIAQLIN